MIENASLEYFFLSIGKEVLERHRCFAVRSDLGLFSTALVIWLNIAKRFSEGRLTDANRQLRELVESGAIHNFVERTSRPLRDSAISNNTGGVSRATSRLKEELVEELFQSSTSQILHQANGAAKSHKNIFFIDGTEVSIAHTEANKSRYPRRRNREKALLYYPKVRVVVAHQLDTGIAAALAIGDHTEHEITLAKQVIDKLPEGSVVVTDRGFNSPKLLAYAEEKGIRVVMRIKETVAKKLMSTADKKGISLWKSADKMSYAQVHGTCHHIKTSEPTSRSNDIYLFTNAGFAGREAGDLYIKRVQIEVAIRHLKQTLKLSIIRSKTPSNIRKEIYLAYFSYNVSAARAVPFLAGSA
jgi:hypothetical protein